MSVVLIKNDGDDERGGGGEMGWKEEKEKGTASVCDPARKSLDRPRGAGDRQEQGGQANAGGARGLEYSLGITGDKTLNTSKNTVMTLLLLRYVTDTDAHTVM